MASVRGSRTHGHVSRPRSGNPKPTFRSRPSLPQSQARSVFVGAHAGNHGDGPYSGAHLWTSWSVAIGHTVAPRVRGRRCDWQGGFLRRRAPPWRKETSSQFTERAYRIQSGPIGSSASLSDPERAYRIQRRPIGSRAGLSDPAQAYPIQSRPIRSRAGLSDPVRAHRIQSDISASLCFKTTGRRSPRAYSKRSAASGLQPRGLARRETRRRRRRRARDTPKATGIAIPGTTNGTWMRARDAPRAREAERDADDAAERRERRRLDEELREDVARARADREAHADLARPLGHRHEHDVHDADAADDERHRGDAGEQRGEHPGDRLEQRLDLARIAHGEVVVVARGDVAAAAQDLGDLAPSRRRCGRRRRPTP